ncbi:MAG: cupin domain-containing protein [Spirochaetales bacterium]|nr:cupin domain-containing protein [Spirochaetales bacterium]
MNDQIKLIAQRISELRRISGEFITDAASACAIGESEYAQYESGEHDIPVGVLHSIAHHYKVELTTLLTGEDPHLHSIAITRSGRGVEVNRRVPYKYLSLAYGFADRKAEPFFVSVAPETADFSPELNTHPGQEFNFVLNGSIKLFFDGREYTLGKGDSVFYDSKKPHGMQAVGAAAEFLSVIF